jgi:toxin ParE1/3/4
MLVSKQFKAIHDHIAKDSLKGALRQAKKILSAIDRLESFPISGRSGDVAEIRELVVPGTPYIVFYRFVGRDILLKSIRHAARQKPQRFSK